MKKIAIFIGLIIVKILSVCVIVGILIPYGIYHAINANWAWADRLSKK